MSAFPQPDIKLIEQAAGGDTEAFAALFDQHYQAVYNYVLWLSGDPDLAEDVTQETFIRAHRSLPRLRPPFNLKAWLYRAAHNLFIDETRRKAPVVPLDTDTRLKAANRDPERELLFSELSSPVRTALKRLSPNHREALVLREVEGFEYADIAAIMGVSLDNVKVLLHRARNSFKDNYRHPLLSEDGLPECEVLRELLDASHDRNVTPDQDAKIKQHIADCVTCQKRKQALAFLFTLFANQPKLKPPSDLHNRLYVNVKKGLKKPGPKPSPKIYWMGALIGLGLAAILGWAIYGPPNSSDNSTSGGPPADTPTASSGNPNPPPVAPVGVVPTPSASPAPGTCEAGWFPSSGCTCCAMTLVCADGTFAEFNPACESGGSASGTTGGAGTTGGLSPIGGGSNPICGCVGDSWVCSDGTHFSCDSRCGCIR